MFTYNDELAFRCPSGLPESFTGAVQSKPLLDYLKEMVEEDVEVSFTGKAVILTGKGHRAGINMDAEVALPLENVTKPRKGGWLPLHEEFSEAVSVVQECAGKDESAIALTCINVTPEWVEACDDVQLTRYRLQTGVDKPFMVRRDSLKEIVGLDMTEFNEAGDWVHFRNPSGLLMSCRRQFDLEYPPLAPLLRMKGGEKSSLPKGLVKAAKKAGIFSKENADDDSVLVQLSPGKVYVKGTGVSGWAEGSKRVTYTGRPLTFYIAPKLLVEIVTRHNQCVVMPDRLVVDGGKWRYATSLGEAPEANGKARKKREEDDG